jgi:hypothetical protein
MIRPESIPTSRSRRAIRGMNMAQPVTARRSRRSRAFMFLASGSRPGWILESPSGQFQTLRGYPPPSHRAVGDKLTGPTKYKLYECSSRISRVSPFR